MKNRSYLKRVLAFCLCIGWVFLLSHCAKEGKSPSSAPDFTLKSLDNQEITLSKLKGKVVLLDFWATWCAPCRESIPHLIQLYNSYKDKGLEVIGMNLDKGSLETIHRFEESMDIPYAITIATEEVARDYGVNALPTTFLIDRSGKIRQKLLGFNSEISKKMTATVAELLSENP
jgi:cytochrome c biogenesis protein CcmG/thiol:disulfide interchange protein DsbE